LLATAQLRITCLCLQCKLFSALFLQMIVWGDLDRFLKYFSFGIAISTRYQYKYMILTLGFLTWNDLKIGSALFYNMISIAIAYLSVHDITSLGFRYILFMNQIPKSKNTNLQLTKVLLVEDISSLVHRYNLLPFRAIRRPFTLEFTAIHGIWLDITQLLLPVWTRCRWG